MASDIEESMVAVEKMLRKEMKKAQDDTLWAKRRSEYAFWHHQFIERIGGLAEEAEQELESQLVLFGRERQNLANLERFHSELLQIRRSIASDPQLHEQLLAKYAAALDDAHDA